MTRQWKQRRRAGLPVMSRHMMLVLQDMRAAKASGFPFVDLSGVHKRTINALVRFDWIFESPGLDGVRYKITLRGEKALKVYERPTYRYDGLCPRCGLRPKKNWSSGKTCGYCDECLRKRDKRQYALKGHQFRPDSVCPMCKERPRLTYRNGKQHTYCAECRHARRAQERRRQHDLNLERIARGEVLLCRRCKAQPRYHTNKYVYDLCPDCQRAYMNAYNARRRGKQVQP